MIIKFEDYARHRGQNLQQEYDQWLSKLLLQILQNLIDTSFQKTHIKQGSLTSFQNFFSITHLLF